MADLEQHQPGQAPQDASPPAGLSQQELDDQTAAELPDREAMSLVNANIAIPINAAVAANVLSDDATAYTDATQDAAMEQST